jgi:hypothetical protein
VSLSRADTNRPVPRYSPDGGLHTLAVRDLSNARCALLCGPHSVRMDSAVRDAVEGDAHDSDRAFLEEYCRRHE